MKKKWIQWSSYDLKQGLGGVEVHARALARELAKEATREQNSQSYTPLFWGGAELSQGLVSSLGGNDVLHTHGSSILPLKVLLQLKFTSREQRPTLVHTLHGTTLGRMWACKEWWWVGGYWAALREFIAVCFADVVVGVHENLWLLRFAQRLKKQVGVCSNGWDAGGREGAAPAVGTGSPQVFAKNGDEPFFVFIGRGDDPVKNLGALRECMKRDSRLALLEVPWDTGPLTSEQVLACLAGDDRVLALVLPSFYEGLPLVVLEALSQGVAVVATRRGGMAGLPAGLEGLSFCEGTDVESLLKALQTAQGTLVGGQKKIRAERNQKLLSTWQDVTKKVLDIVRLHC